MIYINNLSISSDRTKLSVDVETNIGSNITQVLLWNDTTFKNYDQAIDLSFKLENINEKEIFIVENTEISIGSFIGIWFLEFTSNHVDDDECTSCQNTVIGIAANLNNIKNYILNEILKLNICSTCKNNYDNIINTHLISKGICNALTLGYYEEAIFLYKKLRKLLGIDLDCNSCRQLVTPTYVDTLNYGIINNTLILL